jgi:putative ABC transport system permease protein
MSWLAFILAFALMALLLPWLNQLSGQDLSARILLRWQVMVPVLITPFLVGLISGIYPSLFMSSFQPVKVLKGLFRVHGNISLRKVLVVLQFAISIVLIINTAIVFRQLKFMQQKSLGFNKDHIVTMNYSTVFNQQFESFRNELLQDKGIKEVARSSRIPTGRLLDAMGTAIPAGDTTQAVNADIKFLSVDYRFIPAYGIGMAAGRNFSQDYSTDSTGFVLNETGVSMLGWKTGDAVGKQIVYGGIKGSIIGVMKDFHFESLHQQIVPMVLLPLPNNYNALSIKLSGNNLPASLAHLEDTWKKFSPETPFDYTFLDERFGKLYASEQKQGTIFTVFAGIAIFIACLGLFGLSAFTISQRVKEIGIRKVLGADVNNIVTLLSADFMKLVIVAAIIAFPLAWYLMHKWLQDFAYRTTIQWWIFIAAGIIAAFVAFMTISFQAVKAASANPVKNLRTE